MIGPDTKKMTFATQNVVPAISPPLARRYLGTFS